MTTGLVSSVNLMFPQSARASEHQAEALVLTCIDFRFVDLEQSFLSGQHLDQAYDWVTLAGASLALTGFPHPAEAEAFWDQLALSRQLHNISKVVIIDHQDCGAYASVYKQPFSDLISEQNLHTQYLTQAYEQIRQRYPDLDVELYFAKLTGEVSLISSHQS
nr:carbonic anhydrase [Thermoleptolyngbya sp. PKUAC-SCTB121]